MHLTMKPHCEKCRSALSAQAEAYICSFECTFCSTCASQLHDACPHCGGELIRRPRRPVSLSDSSQLPLQTTPIARPWLIWLISLGSWSCIALASAVSLYQIDLSLGKPVPFRTEFIFPAINDLPFAVLTALVFSMALRIPIWEKNWRRWLVYLAAGFGFTVGHIVLRGCLYPVFDPRINSYTHVFWNSATHAFTVQWNLLQRMFLYNVVDDVVTVYFPVVLMANVVCYYRQLRQREVRTSQLETELAKAHLQALKTQLQPHFLFNTLHSISALMLTNVSAADRMMTRLSDLLRLSLENRGIQITSLRSELEFVTGYLEIEKIRFQDRLNVVFDVAPNTLDAQVPHLLLQPLVENAVRHGISRSQRPGEIHISASHDDRSLHLRVADNCLRANGDAPNSLGTGIGLETIRGRLETLYGDTQHFDIRSDPGSGFEVCISIPLTFDPSPQMHGGEMRISFGVSV